MSAVRHAIREALAEAGRHELVMCGTYQHARIAFGEAVLPDTARRNVSRLTVEFENGSTIQFGWGEAEKFIGCRYHGVYGTHDQRLLSLVRRK